MVTFLLSCLGPYEFSWLLPVIDVLIAGILYSGFKAIDTEDDLWFGLVIVLADIWVFVAYIYDPSMIALTLVPHM